MAFFKDILSPWRIIRILLLLFLILGIILAIYFFAGETESEVTFGVTFSQTFTEQMGLEWKKVYIEMLDDLGVRKMRLIAYWERVESEKDNYFFDDLDWQIREARKRGVEIILAVGRKLPRWPECHIPDWARDLSESKQQERILKVIEEVVQHYRDESSIKIWQVENEPFLIGFGECPPLDKDFLDREIALVKSLDSKGRPILLTASGELSSWIQPAIKGDILGTTLYRTIWNDLLGHFKYPIPSIFYGRRADFVKWVTGIEKIFIVELQGEPWSKKMIYEISAEEQNKSMDLAAFKNIIQYTRKTGFDEAYFWGVEWWYRRKIDGDDSFWQEAKKLF